MEKLIENSTLEEAQEIYKMIEKNNILSKYKFPEHPSSDGIYRIWVKDSTKKTGRRQLTSKSLDTLKDKVYEFESGIHNSTKKTFEEVFELVLQKKLMAVKDKERVKSRINTISKDRSVFNRFFSEAPFVNKYIDLISAREIECYTEQYLLKNCVKKKAYKAYRGVIKQCFDRAYKDYLVKENIYERVDFNQFNGLLLKSEPIENRYHPDEEYSLILNSLIKWQSKHPYDMRGYALELQMKLGRRIGEVTPLLKKDVSDSSISIKKEQIYVRDTKKMYWSVVNYTKDGDAIEYPRFSEVNDVLDKVFKVLESQYVNSDYLFPSSRTTTGFVTNKSVYELYVKICNELGIELSYDCIKGTHSFRRNASTDILNLTNGNMQMENYLLGHTPEVARKNYYVRPNMDDMIDVLNRRFNQA